jgi:hypothetical protein
MNASDACGYVCMAKNSRIIIVFKIKIAVVYSNVKITVVRME